MFALASGAEACLSAKRVRESVFAVSFTRTGRARGRPYWDAEALRVTRVARLALTRARGGPYWYAAAPRVARSARLASTVLLVSAGYYVGGIIGIALRFPPSGIATIWPPTAILLSALLLTPPRTWWVYLLAAVPTHIHLVANFQTDVPPVVMFTQVGTNDLHAVLAALAVRSAVGAPPRFDSLRSMVLYILYARHRVHRRCLRSGRVRVRSPWLGGRFLARVSAAGPGERVRNHHNPAFDSHHGHGRAGRRA